VNWQETKVHDLCSREDEPLTPAVLGQQVAVVEEFVCLAPNMDRRQIKNRHY